MTQAEFEEKILNNPQYQLSPEAKALIEQLVIHQITMITHQVVDNLTVLNAQVFRSHMELCQALVNKELSK